MIFNLLASARAELPRHRLACWASICFSASVLTLLLSVAATQSFLALASVLYFAYLLRERPEIRFPPVKLPLAWYCVWTVIAAIWAATPAASGFEIRKLSLFLFMLLAVNLVVSGKHLRFLFQVMFLESAIAGIAGVEQFIRRYREVRIEHPHRIYVYMTVLRIHGFMGHWMNFGGQQMLIFAMLLAFLLLSVKWKEGASSAVAAPANRSEAREAWQPAPASAGPSPQSRPALKRSAAFRWSRLDLGWIAMAVIVISIILNLTRGVWLGCFAGAIYVVARWRARWLWALPVLIAVFLIAGPRLMRHRMESVLHPSRDPSLAIRFQMWRVGWRMIRKHPLVGVGPDNIPGVYNLYLPPGMVPIVGYHEHLHNDYIQLAAARGLPCLAAWLWFMLALGWGIVKRARRLTSLRWVAHGALAGWLGLLLEGCFEFNFGTSPVLMVFLFVISTPFAAEFIESSGRHPGSGMDRGRN